MPRTGRRRTSSGIGRALQYTRGSFAAPVCAVAPLLRWSGKGRPRAFLREKQLRCSMKHRDKGDLLQRCGAESRDCMWWRWSRDSIAIVLSNKIFFTKVESSVHKRFLGCCGKTDQNFSAKLLSDQNGDQQETTTLLFGNQF